MGNHVSTPPKTPLSSPNLDGNTDLPHCCSSLSPPPLEPATAIVVRSSYKPFQYPPLWVLEYRLNLGPVCQGQKVMLYCNAEDHFDPDPLSKPVADGWLVKVVNRTPSWLTFLVVDVKGAEVAMLQVPYVPSAKPVTCC